MSDLNNQGKACKHSRRSESMLLRLMSRLSRLNRWLKEVTAVRLHCDQSHVADAFAREPRDHVTEQSVPYIPIRRNRERAYRARDAAQVGYLVRVAV